MDSGARASKGRSPHPKSTPAEMLSYSPPDRLSCQSAVRQIRDRLFDILDIMEMPPLAIGRGGISHPAERSH